MRKSLRFLLGCLVAFPIGLLIISGVSADAAQPSSSAQHGSGAGGLLPSPPVSISATPEPDSLMSPDERLARPHMSDPPTQVELGHYSYYMSCMVCHADRGQGFTDEWRTVLDPADRNCWQSKCHAPNHPPEGFEIPRNAPAVIGPGALDKYRTAADLFAYLRERMPWPFPGLFEDEEYWQLTAYLVSANNIWWGKKALGPDNAADVLIEPDLPQAHRLETESERAVTLVVVALLLGTVTVQRWIRVRA